MLLHGIEAVFLDAVGTLLEPEPAAAVVYAQVARRHGSRLVAAEIAVRFRRALDWQEELDRAADFRTSEQRERERWRQVVQSVLDDVADHEACFHELYEHFARPQAWRCLPEAGPVLEGLARRGLVLGLASNYDGRLRRVAAGLSALGPLRHIVISSEVGWRKPALAFFAALCRVVRLPAPRILFVGDDRTQDYEGACSAGLHGVLFDPRGRQGQTAARITSLTELLA